MKTRQRHQLKQNEFVTGFNATLTWFAEHRDTALAGAAIVAVVAIIGGGYMWWRSNEADKAGALYGDAMATYESPVVPASTLPGATSQAGSFISEQARDDASLAAFQKVVAAYPNTTAGRAALYQSAEVYLSAGKFADAQRVYQQVVDQAGNTVYAPLAKMGIAQSQLGAGQTDLAIKTLEALAAERDGALPIDGVLMQLANAYLKAGKTQEARTAFKRVTDEFPDSVYVADARKQIALLG